MDSLTAQELKAVKEVKALAEEYGWDDDHSEFKDMLKQVRKKFKKEAGKMNKCGWDLLNSRDKQSCSHRPAVMHLHHTQTHHASSTRPPDKKG